MSVVSPSFVSDAGMFADTGVELPPACAPSPPRRWAAAWCRAIERNRAEINVAPLALRLGARAYEMAPGPMAALQRKLGSHEIAARMARAQSGKR